MTLVGGVFRAMTPLRMGLAGADIGGHVRETGRLLAPGQAHLVAAGSTMAFPGVADANAGARAYLAMHGGIDVPVVLGSRSTALAAGFGGLEGRAARSGDVIVATTEAERASGPRYSMQAQDSSHPWPESVWPADDAEDDSNRRAGEWARRSRRQLVAGRRGQRPGRAAARGPDDPSR